MPNRFSFFLLAATLTLIPLTDLWAADLTGRASILGNVASPEQGDIGETHQTTADQQSLRLMLDDYRKNTEWSLHLKTLRQHFNGLSSFTPTASQPFRIHSLAGELLNETPDDSYTRLAYEFDRAVFHWRSEQATLSLGRQPIEWGSGRFWQPLNVFGAFAPTDLDTDYKQGIDAATLQWYPSAFASLTAAYVPGSADDNSSKDSAAAYYRGLIGDRTELSLLAGQVLGNNLLGTAIESDWFGIGWRVEGTYYDQDNRGEDGFFWIAGLDYQFDNGILATAEWYNNELGSSTESGLASIQSTELIQTGIQPNLGKQVLGLSLSKDLTPLLRGSYTLLISPLENNSNQHQYSTLQQFNLNYSLSNESELLLSLLFSSGKGLNGQQQIQSEFGHIPAGAVVRWRMYF